MKKFTNFLVLILAISLCFIIGCEPLAEPPTEPPSGSPSGAPSGSLPELVEIGDLFEYFYASDGEVHVRTEENFYLNQTIMSEVIGGQNAESIVIEGARDNVTFTVTGTVSSPIHANNGAKITFKNITIVDNSHRGSNWDNGRYLGFSGKVRFENCNLPEIMLMTGSEVEIINCSFNSASDPSWYSLWIADGVALVQNCTFTGYRAIKIDEDHGTDVDSVMIDGCVFSDVNRAGVSMSAINSTTQITIKNCAFTNCDNSSSDYKEVLDGMYEANTLTDEFIFSQTNNMVNDESADLLTPIFK